MFYLLVQTIALTDIIYIKVTDTHTALTCLHLKLQGLYIQRLFVDLLKTLLEHRQTFLRLFRQ